MGERMMRPLEVWRFVKNYARLLSGTTIFEYITGIRHHATHWTYDVFVSICFLAAPLLHLVRPETRLSGQERGLGYGLLSGLILFYLVAGNRSIEPHHERYAMFLLVPSLLLVAILVGKLNTVWQRRTLWGYVALSGLMLAVFYLNYFQAIRVTGGQRAHSTFRTGEKEPKTEALRRVFEDAAREKVEAIRISVDDYWLIWCVRYLSARRDDVTVEMFRETFKSDANEEGATDEGLYAVVYTDTTTDVWYRERAGWKKLKGTSIQGFAGHEVLAVYRRSRTSE
jgi:hypothetical protein